MQLEGTSLSMKVFRVCSRSAGPRLRKAGPGSSRRKFSNRASTPSTFSPPHRSSLPHPAIPPTMFRTALLRSARQAIRAAPRCQAPIGRPVARSSLFQAKQITPAARFQAVRCYASSSGLSKDEVEGRIMDLLKNFDKVTTVRWDVEAMADSEAGPGHLEGTGDNFTSF